MKTIFADTFYWIALINKTDEWHKQVRSYSSSLKAVTIVTTEEVLTETVNFFSNYPPLIKQTVYNFVVQIMADPHIQVMVQEHKSFTNGLLLFQKRLDKGYSLTDCISMERMKNLNIYEVLTHDQHFQQEGFLILFP
ncbi:hypothetical protein PN462_05060 [Spirulina sp. CS-785/01]|uniref:type II toxin-antitoxin system VapC family toxin n=1 Tax=Spirulina sp. CS-785/01 TaxID=3021716 RepID=UPI00232AD605|nr:hypothetical protein [Spirulina sp. CS-785/01]MDB9312465.1 hypothetical protein [Spirulina sp. CS-785/01]